MPEDKNKPKPKEEKKDEKAEKDKKTDLGLLEEDDEFEEFPTEDWAETTEDPEDEAEGINVWEDNWDDDVVEDDFSKQLRAILEQQAQKAA